MKVHLLRSKEYSIDEFWDVFNLISRFSGPIQFLTKEEPLSFDDEELNEDLVGDDKFFVQKEYSEAMMHYSKLEIKKDILSWDNLFKKCEKYRVKYSIPSQDQVILLTTLRNDNNWFSAFDPKGVKNAFVHTGYWDYYINSHPRFPIAYSVASNVLRMMMFDDFTTMQAHMHRQSLGCMNDLNQNKREVILKLRTADICVDCIKILFDRNVDRLLIRQVINVFEGIREQMLFNQGFKLMRDPSKLLITHDLKLFLPDFNNIEIKLRPLDKALYFLYLNHPQGIFLHDLIEYKYELKRLYQKISTSATAEQIDASIQALTNFRDESINEKISRIKRIFVDVLGKDIATQYYIKGERGGVKAIELNRELIISKHLIST